VEFISAKPFLFLWEGFGCESKVVKGSIFSRSWKKNPHFVKSFESSETFDKRPVFTHDREKFGGK